MKHMNHKGVTLIELVVVFVIIAIGAMLTVPNIRAWLPNYRLKSATRDIVSTMRTAQMKAVSTNLQYRVYFNPGEGKYWIEKGDQSSGSTNWVGSVDLDNAAREGAIYTLPSGVSISPAGFIQFNPNSTCNAATITVSNNRGKRSIITLVMGTGKVNVRS
ncbi:MAG: ral secretion pathway protein [Deltaproteobacteria bacterium]|jgi:prepilin-type N-terminal cleavage/methylation domain-containing protein|nr:ral secretion pathway protein [Deltaproteobacteria bacterium]